MKKYKKITTLGLISGAIVTGASASLAVALNNKNNTAISSLNKAESNQIDEQNLINEESTQAIETQDTNDYTGKLKGNFLLNDDASVDIPTLNNLKMDPYRNGSLISNNGKGMLVPLKGGGLVLLDLNSLEVIWTLNINGYQQINQSNSKVYKTLFFDKINRFLVVSEDPFNHGNAFFTLIDPVNGSIVEQGNGGGKFKLDGDTPYIIDKIHNNTRWDKEGIVIIPQQNVKKDKMIQQSSVVWFTSNKITSLPDDQSHIQFSKLFSGIPSNDGNINIVSARAFFNNNLREEYAQTIVAVAMTDHGAYVTGVCGWHTSGDIQNKEFFFRIDAIPHYAYYRPVDVSVKEALSNSIKELYIEPSMASDGSLNLKIAWVCNYNYYNSSVFLIRANFKIGSLKSYSSTWVKIDDCFATKDNYADYNFRSGFIEGDHAYLFGTFLQIKHGKSYPPSIVDIKLSDWDGYNTAGHKSIEDLKYTGSNGENNRINFIDVSVMGFNTIPSQDNHPDHFDTFPLIMPLGHYNRIYLYKMPTDYENNLSKFNNRLYVTDVRTASWAYSTGVKNGTDQKKVINVPYKDGITPDNVTDDQLKRDIPSGWIEANFTRYVKNSTYRVRKIPKSSSNAEISKVYEDGGVPATLIINSSFDQNGVPSFSATAAGRSYEYRVDFYGYKKMGLTKLRVPVYHDPELGNKIKSANNKLYGINLQNAIKQSILNNWDMNNNGVADAKIDLFENMTSSLINEPGNLQINAASYNIQSKIAYAKFQLNKSFDENGRITTTPKRFDIMISYGQSMSPSGLKSSSSSSNSGLQVNNSTTILKENNMSNVFTTSIYNINNKTYSIGWKKTTSTITRLKFFVDNQDSQISIPFLINPISTKMIPIYDQYGTFADKFIVFSTDSIKMFLIDLRSSTTKRIELKNYNDAQNRLNTLAVGANIVYNPNEENLIIARQLNDDDNSQTFGAIEKYSLSGNKYICTSSATTNRARSSIKLNRLTNDFISINSASGLNDNLMNNQMFLHDTIQNQLPVNIDFANNCVNVVFFDEITSNSYAANPYRFALQKDGTIGNKIKDWKLDPIKTSFNGLINNRYYLSFNSLQNRVTHLTVNDTNNNSANNLVVLDAKEADSYYMNFVDNSVTNTTQKQKLVRKYLYIGNDNKLHILKFNPQDNNISIVNYDPKNSVKNITVDVNEKIYDRYDEYNNNSKPFINQMKPQIINKIYNSTDVLSKIYPRQNQKLNDLVIYNDSNFDFNNNIQTVSFSFESVTQNLQTIGQGISYINKFVSINQMDTKLEIGIDPSKLIEGLNVYNYQTINERLDEINKQQDTEFKFDQIFTITNPVNLKNGTQYTKFADPGLQLVKLTETEVTIGMSLQNVIINNQFQLYNQWTWTFDRPTDGAYKMPTTITVPSKYSNISSSYANKKIAVQDSYGKSLIYDLKKSLADEINRLNGTDLVVDPGSAISFKENWNYNVSRGEIWTECDIINVCTNYKIKFDGFKKFKAATFEYINDEINKDKRNIKPSELQAFLNQKASNIFYFININNGIGNGPESTWIPYLYDEANNTYKNNPAFKPNDPYNPDPKKNTTINAEVLEFDNARGTARVQLYIKNAMTDQDNVPLTDNDTVNPAYQIKKEIIFTDLKATSKLNEVNYEGAVNYYARTFVDNNNLDQVLINYINGLTKSYNIESISNKRTSLDENGYESILYFDAKIKSSSTTEQFKVNFNKGLLEKDSEIKVNKTDFGSIKMDELIDTYFDKNNKYQIKMTNNQINQESLNFLTSIFEVKNNPYVLVEGSTNTSNEFKNNIRYARVLDVNISNQIQTSTISIGLKNLITNHSLTSNQELRIDLNSTNNCTMVSRITLYDQNNNEQVIFKNDSIINEYKQNSSNNNWIWLIVSASTLILLIFISITTYLYFAKKNKK